jgi:hypothetical protein
VRRLAIRSAASAGAPAAPARVRETKLALVPSRSPVLARQIATKSGRRRQSSVANRLRTAAGTIRE